MNDRNPKHEYLFKGVTAFLVIAACVLFAFIVFKIDVIFKAIGRVIGVLKPVIFGLVIAYLVNPMVNFFDKYISKVTLYKAKNEEKAARVADFISVIVSILIFTGIIAGLFWLVIPQLIDSITEFVKTFPQKLDSITELSDKFLQENEGLRGVFDSVVDYEKNWLANDLSGFVSDMAGSLASGVWSVVNFFKNFLLGLIFAIYLLCNKEKMTNQSKKMLFALLSEKTVGRILSWLAKSHKVFSGFINGKLLDSLIIGVLCFIGTLIMGTPYYMLVSTIIGVTNIIPVFGPYIGGIPCVILVTITNPLKGLYFGIFIICLQMLDGNFIGPKILGDKTGLSNFWVMFAIVVGGGLFSVVGMLIGVPAFAVIYYAFALFINYRLKKKNMSTNSADYSREALEARYGKEEEHA